MSAPSVGSVEDNKRLAWSEFLSGRTRLDSKPFKASIEITRNCNYKCVMCAQSWNPSYARYRPEYNMSPELFRRLTKELFPHLEYAHLQGYGESVISPHWLDILELCRPFADRLRFGIVTNLSRRNAAMWRNMVELGFAIIFSCDGATKGTFEAIRVGSRFEGVLENLSAVAEARRELGRGGLDVHVTLQRMNYREMPLFVELAARHGADRVTFASVRGSGAAMHHAWRLVSWVKQRRLDAAAVRTMANAAARLIGLRPWEWARHGSLGVSIYSLPPAALLDAKRAALRRGRELGLPVVFDDEYLARLGEPGAPEPVPAPPPQDHLAGIEDSVRVAARQRCFKPFSYTVVNYKGDVGLCNHLITDEGWKQMGNLREQTFEEIWNSAVYQEQRRRLLDGRPDNDCCRWCFAHRSAD